jgi:predicted nucleic acid-binding protein
MPVIVLDTNVISELMRPQPDQGVLAWANSLDPESAAITAMNEAEILHGLARLPDGRRKQALRESWDVMAAELFAGRVWAFTSEAAHWYGALVSHRKRLARAAEPIPVQPDARFVACPASRRGRKVQCSSCGRQGQGEHRAGP